MSGIVSRFSNRGVCSSAFAGALNRSVAATAYAAPLEDLVVPDGAFVPFSDFLTRSPVNGAFDITTAMGPPDVKYVRVRVPGLYLISYNITFITGQPQYCLALYVNGEPVTTKGSTLGAPQSVTVSETVAFELDENSTVGVRVLTAPITITGGVNPDPKLYLNTPTLTIVRLR